LADKPDPAGLDKMASSFCYPVEIAHGLVQDLINKNVDYIFLPHVSQMDHDDDHKYKRLCVFVQGEPYYIRSAFADTHHPPFITPVLDLTLSETEVKKTFVSIARQIGVNEPEALRAFEFADSQFKSMLNEFKNIGRKILEDVEANNRTAMVLFGRAYNAFAGEANLNIPHKFASRNIIIIPHDFLPNDDYGSYSNMYWFSGQQILRSARFVKDHPLLFGVYITNFSCGPDSFILSYFRNLMGNKPSLTLELDSHSADVGVDTRIDAALDIIRNYNELKRQGLVVESKKELSALSIESRENRVAIIDDEGNEFRLTSPEVEVIIPSMGRFSTESFSAVCRSLGFNSKPLPIPTSDTLKFGRGLTTCKECLPFILTTGSLIEYVEKVKNSGKKVLFFMPHGYGPCRQGQYYIMLKDIINNLKYKNIGVLSMDDESSFDDLGNDFYLKGWLALMTADIIHDIESVINTLAVDKESSLQMLESEWEKIISALESGNKDMLFSRLQKSAETLKSIKLKTPLKDAKVVSLIGEIYVRREEFSRQDLIHSLVDRGFVVRTAPITEYLYYSNYLIRKGIVNGDIRDKAKIIIKDFYQRYYEKKIKKILAASGLYHFEMIDIDKTVDYGKKMVSEKLVGETIITAGLAVREILDNSCGVISIGPFNCMPSRLSEALLNREMTIEGKYRNGNKKSFGYSLDITSLPFLYIESDGNPYPQITQSRLEIFMMQAEKVHHSLKNKEIKKT
jgi:predicted nucleotide-binding protein (sugar kinase/HSP70/actin superfamily)